MSLSDTSMGVCQQCGREYNTARLSACPACGTLAGGAVRQAAPTGYAQPSPVPVGYPAPPQGGSSARSGFATREAATRVASLGSIIVGVAYFVGIAGSLGGALVALMSLGGPDVTKGAGFLYGLFIVGASLVQAAFLALVGRYAQMRAGQVLDA